MKSDWTSSFTFRAWKRKFILQATVPSSIYWANQTEKRQHRRFEVRCGGTKHPLSIIDSRKHLETLLNAKIKELTVVGFCNQRSWPPLESEPPRWRIPCFQNKTQLSRDHNQIQAMFGRAVWWKGATDQNSQINKQSDRQTDRRKGRQKGGQIIKRERERER